MTKVFTSGLVAFFAFAVVSSCGSDPSGDGSDAAGGESGAADTGGTSGTSGTSGSAGRGGSSGGGSGGTSGESGSGASGESGEGGTATGGASGTGGTGGGDRPCSAEDLPEVYAAAVCTKNADCCPSSELASCPDRIETAVLNFAPALGAAVETGVAELDCDALAECLSGIDSQSCASWAGDGASIGLLEPSCNRVILGRRAPGSSCQHGYECRDGGCADPDGDGPEPMQCFAWRTADEPCVAEAVSPEDFEAICSPFDYFCNEDSTCEAYRGEELECGSDFQCRSMTCDSEIGRCAPLVACSFAQ